MNFIKSEDARKMSKASSKYLGYTSKRFIKVLDDGIRHEAFENNTETLVIKFQRTKMNNEPLLEWKVFDGKRLKTDFIQPDEIDEIIYFLRDYGYSPIIIEGPDEKLELEITWR